MDLGIHSDITDYIVFCRLVKRKMKIVFVLKEMAAGLFSTLQRAVVVFYYLCKQKGRPRRTVPVCYSTRQLLSSASIYLYVCHLPIADEYESILFHNDLLK